MEKDIFGERGYADGMFGMEEKWRPAGRLYA